MGIFMSDYLTFTSQKDSPKQAPSDGSALVMRVVQTFNQIDDVEKGICEILHETKLRYGLD